MILSKRQYSPEWEQLFPNFANPIRQVSLAVSRLPHQGDEHPFSYADSM